MVDFGRQVTGGKCPGHGIGQSPRCQLVIDDWILSTLFSFSDHSLRYYHHTLRQGGQNCWQQQRRKVALVTTPHGPLNAREFYAALEKNAQKKMANKTMLVGLRVAISVTTVSIRWHRVFDLSARACVHVCLPGRRHSPTNLVVLKWCL